MAHDSLQERGLSRSRLTRQEDAATCVFNEIPSYA